MCNDFKDYVCTFCQLCTHYAHLYRLCITHIWHSTSTMWHYIWYISQTCYFHLCRLPCQLLRILDDCTLHIEEGGQTDVIYTDFEKPFDKVPHKCLIRKLYSYGINQDVVLWIKAGFVELCTKILQIMCNDFKDYACTFCQLCTHYAHLYRLLYYTYLAFNIDNVTLYLVYISQTCYFHLCHLSSTTQTWCHCQTGYCVCTCLSWLLQRHPCGSPDVQSTLVPL